MGSKTPTRSRVGKIGLNLTPNNRETEKEAKEMKETTDIKGKVGLTEALSSQFLRRTKVK